MSGIPTLEVESNYLPVPNLPSYESSDLMRTLQAVDTQAATPTFRQQHYRLGLGTHPTPSSGRLPFRRAALQQQPVLFSILLLPSIQLCTWLRSLYLGIDLTSIQLRPVRILHLDRTIMPKTWAPDPGFLVVLIHPRLPKTSIRLPTPALAVDCKCNGAEKEEGADGGTEANAYLGPSAQLALSVIGDRRDGRC